MQEAINIHPSQFIEYIGQPRPFFGQKTGIFLVALPVFQVDFLVGYIPVAANDEFAATVFQFFQVWLEFIQETEFGFLSLR